MSANAFECGVLEHETGRWLLSIAGSRLVQTRYVQPTEKLPTNSPSSKEHIAALLRLLDGEDETYTMPFALNGSPFFMQVWAVLQQVPYGKVTSYAALARAAGSPRAHRAAGSACARNPLALVIPCHRVLGSNGSFGGYAYGLQAKETLLAYEARRYA